MHSLWIFFKVPVSILGQVCFSLFTECYSLPLQHLLPAASTSLIKYYTSRGAYCRFCMHVVNQRVLQCYSIALNKRLLTGTSFYWICVGHSNDY